MSSTVQSQPPTSTQPLATDSGSKAHAQSASSNIYLVTFLATLFCLLFFSCGIVLRSYILRRRYQRRLEQAIASGMLLVHSPGSRRARFGAKPKMFDSWIASGGEKWKEMNPLAAQPVYVYRKSRGPKSPEAHQPAVPSMNGGQAQSFWQRLRMSPSRTNAIDDHDQTGAITPTTAQTPPSATTNKYRAEMLQISVLIAMPSKDRSQKKAMSPELKKLNDDDEEEPLPEMVLGVTRVLYRHRKSPKTDRTLSQTFPPSPIEPLS